MDRPEIAARYDLAAHPEGGWYRQTWMSQHQLRLTDENGAERVRQAATLILFCLPPGECSAWHRVASEEIWIWNGAGPITLRLGGDAAAPAEDPTTVVLGGDAEAGELVQLTVPAGVWQRTLPSDQVGLASCLVCPGFDFADFTLASPLG